MKIIYTIGHSVLKIDGLTDMLKVHGIEFVADVRTAPKSKYAPQFNSHDLEDSLKKEIIAYMHLPELGGFRHAKKDSINTGWKNERFRGYADYMQTEEFFRGLDMLMNMAEKHTTAIMCAEALPYKCHRSLVADALLLRGFIVQHIMPDGKAIEHKMTDFAMVKDGRVIYPETKK